MNLFQKFRSGLLKTQQKIVGEIKRIVTRTPRLDADALDELEAVLVSTDIGIETAMAIVAQTRQACEASRTVDVLAIARAEIEKELNLEARPRGLARAATAPTVILLAGVNGTGKTTSTAKLAHHLKGQGASVLLAACDTFRAAAIEQLKLWGQRLHVEVVAGAYGADAASVAHDGVAAAQARQARYLFVDTAGRLHTKHNLMQELQKLHRVIGRQLPGAPHEVLLVLDATTGMNALTQAREFNKAVPLTGLVITKLDGTSKGGMVVAIQKELGLPVKFVGLGEQADDLQPFDAKQFSEALFESEPA